jgi:hypothetical protein
VNYLFRRLLLIVASFAVLAIIYDLGFEKHPGENQFLLNIYLFSLILGIIPAAGRYFLKKTRRCLCNRFDCS